MRKQIWLLAFILLPLILSVSVVESDVNNVEPMADTANVAVDPSKTILDYDLMPVGSTHKVNLTVADVENLGTWQVNMTYDPTVLSWTSGRVGDFLAGNPSMDWYGRPYAHATQPSTVVVRSPGSTLPLPFPSPYWTTPQNAYTSNGNPVYPPAAGQYASTNIDGPTRYQQYYGYGTFTGVTSVLSLEVGLETFTPQYGVVDPYYNGSVLEADYIELQTSNDGGTSWGPIHPISVFPSEILWWEDCTDDFAWTPTMINTALRTRVRYVQVGVNATTLYLDHIPVRVTDTIVVENPGRAWDTVLDSYAELNYGQRDGTFTVRDYAHFFPGGGSDPAMEASKIVQVDFYMKFAANASSSGDQYRIYYTSPVIFPDEVVLEDWTSSATADGTYSWLDQPDPNDDPFDPFTWGWEWDSVANIRFTVGIKRGTGDPAAQFYEYEAWVIVKYLRPTTSAYSVDNTDGFVLYGESTSGAYAGVSGSGWLGEFTFDVIGYGYTGLNITYATTKLLDMDTPPNLIPRTTSDGYFRNALLGDATLDGVVDVFDVLKVKYHRSGPPPGPGPYIREVDINDDGSIDVFDILIVKANLGRGPVP